MLTLKKIFFEDYYYSILFVYLLAALGLSCGMWDLPLRHAGSSLQWAGFSLIVACGLISCGTQAL